MSQAARRPRVVVVGAGFAGVAMAVHLLRAGHPADDLVVLERSDSVGGVWRDNTYPGAACDVPSHLYSFSFDTRHDWSRRYGTQPEIHAYLRSVADRFGVSERIGFGTDVSAAAWDDVAGCWHLETSTGPVVADVLVTAVGQLSRPQRPRLPGLDGFAGAMFHSAEWDHSVDLTGKRVGVVGTGASAIQFVPAIVDDVASLTLFQRSPATVLPKYDYPYPRLLRHAFSRVPGLQRLSRWFTYATYEPRAIAFTKATWLMRLYRGKVERHLARGVTDLAKRDALRSEETIGCKRILLSNDYYPALDRDHVQVSPHAASEVTPSGVRTTDGSEHPLDVVVLGTGFAATRFLGPMQVTGRDGLDLHASWSEGAEAHLGMTVHGFPNLFLLYGPNTNLGHSSVVLMVEAQVRYVLQAVERVAAGRTLEVRERVQRRFVAAVHRRMAGTVWQQGCHNWYRTESGRNVNNWPGLTLEYFARTRRLRDAEFDSRRRAAQDVPES